MPEERSVAMAEPSLSLHDEVILDLDGFEALFGALIERGYKILGPAVRDGAIVYDELRSSADLPAGWTDTQDGGTYRLSKRQDGALFGYAVGPQSWKKFLHPPVVRLWQAQRSKDGFQVAKEPTQEVPKMAFVGVRACELNAIVIHDRVFLSGAYVDPGYKARREKTFIVAVNCGHAGGTCFCASMNTGPKVASGFDLALTEVMEDGRHFFVAEPGTESGAEVLSGLPFRPAGDTEKAAARQIVARTTGQMGRSLDVTEINKLLSRNLENPRWKHVAARCMACANCTMVCPTCFCTTVEDVTDLKGEHAERWRKWDSCFTVDFSYIHGGSVRTSFKARYRQWMTHKLATWIDQFGTSGCVGCGRCITWCPVGIDITAEVRAIRETDAGTISKKGNGNGEP